MLDARGERIEEEGEQQVVGNDPDDEKPSSIYLPVKNPQTPPLLSWSGCSGRGRVCPGFLPGNEGRPTCQNILDILSAGLGISPLVSVLSDLLITTNNGYKHRGRRAEYYSIALA